MKSFIRCGLLLVCFLVLVNCLENSERQNNRPFRRAGRILGRQRVSQTKDGAEEPSPSLQDSEVKDPEPKLESRSRRGPSRIRSTSPRKARKEEVEQDIKEDRNIRANAEKSRPQRISISRSQKKPAQIPKVEEDKLEKIEEAPQIIEAPPPSFPLKRKEMPNNPAKAVSAPMEAPLTESLPSLEPESKTTRDSQKTEELVKEPTIPEEPVEIPGTFSYKFTPQENPSRTDALKVEEPDVPPKTSIDAVSKNINELPGTDKINSDQLQTSESRQRSKVEIKEVNGTLYEYEYIYYYDDEYPMYDYDTPSITDAGERTTKTSATTATTTTTTQAPTRTRAPSGRSRSRQRSQEVVQEENNEIIPSTSSTSRQSGRSSSRQTSRSRGSSRFVEPDNIALEDTFQDSSIPEVSIPAQTRFPPRGTATTSESSILEQQFIEETAAIGGELSVGDLTTEEGLSVTDKSVADLYALSRAIDAEFSETTTEYPSILEQDTQLPIDYDSLYDYDFALSELTDADLGTTTDYDLTTEEPTTTEPSTTTTSTTTTTTTTTPTTTTTTTTTTEPPTTTDRLSRLGGGFPRRRPFARGRSASEQDDTESKAEETTTATNSRFNRLGFRNRGSFNRDRGNEEVKDDTQSENTQPESTKPERKLPSNLRASRPRPNFRNRFSSKSSTVKEAEKIDKTTSTNLEESPGEAKPEPSARPRRLPPRARGKFKNRLNRNQKAGGEEGTEEPTEEPAETPKNTRKPAKLSPLHRQRPERRHRFNIRNRKRGPGSSSAPKETSENERETAPPASPAPSTEPETVNEEAKEEKKETSPPTRRGRVNRRRERVRPNLRFRGKGGKKKIAKEPEVTEDDTEQVEEEPIEPDNETETPVETDPTPEVKSVSRANNRAAARSNRRRKNRRLPPTFQRGAAKKEPVDETPVEEPTPEAVESEVVTGEVDIPFLAEEPANEAHEETAAQEDVTEVPVIETTTRKLTRKELLARRRNRFAGR